MFTLVVLLILAAFVCAILSAMGNARVPLWVAVILLTLALAVQVIPVT